MPERSDSERWSGARQRHVRAAAGALRRADQALRGEQPERLAHASPG